jgi:hypothetical protein
MKHFCAFFFLVIMILNATLPLVTQFQCMDLCELVEAGTDDVDDENKSEKEGEKEGEEQELEKKSITLSSYLMVKSSAHQFEQFNRSIFPLNELPESELYTSLLEFPPEA